LARRGQHWAALVEQACTAATQQRRVTLKAITGIVSNLAETAAAPPDPKLTQRAVRDAVPMPIASLLRACSKLALRYGAEPNRSSDVHMAPGSVLRPFFGCIRFEQGVPAVHECAPTLDRRRRSGLLLSWHTT